MKKTAATLLLLLLLAGCGTQDKYREAPETPDPPTSDKEYISLVHRKAPSWEAYSDEEILQFMERACSGDELISEAQEAQVPERERAYLLGLSFATVCSK